MYHSYDYVGSGDHSTFSDDGDKAKGLGGLEAKVRKLDGLSDGTAPCENGPCLVYVPRVVNGAPCYVLDVEGTVKVNLQFIEFGNGVPVVHQSMVWTRDKVLRAIESMPRIKPAQNSSLAQEQAAVDNAA